MCPLGPSPEFIAWGDLYRNLLLRRQSKSYRKKCVVLRTISSVKRCFSVTRILQDSYNFMQYLFFLFSFNLIWMVTELFKNMKVLRNRFNFDSEKHSGCMKNKSNKKKCLSWTKRKIQYSRVSTQTVLVGCRILSALWFAK